MAYDAIIIGAGMSGLAAGIRLAMYDKKVLILERHYVAGGLNSYYHKFKRPFDVGLHAMTNFVPKGTKRAPLTKLLRQLRIPYDAFQLREQHGSQIHFPSVQLDFDNDFETLRAEVRRAFPDQIDGFDALTKRVLEFDDTSLDAKPIPSREILEEHLSEPLLIEMLFCPLMYYGSPNENEMEFGQFCIMWKSVFSEGFARPEGGVRTIIDLLVKKFKELGGELRYSQGVSKILTKGGKAYGVELERERGLTKISTKPRPRSDQTEVLEATQILSTAGAPETWAMTEGLSADEPKEAGALTFMESIACLDVEPKELGADKTIVFFNRSDERFDYSRAEDYADLRSGVICATNNYAHETPLPEGILRVTSIANWEKWRALEKPEPYNELKEKWYEGQLQVMEDVIPGLRENNMRDRVTVHDVFTPTTIWHFTRKERGAIYGAPEKLRSGITPIENLYVGGTDQGFLGIIGAMLSGISIANAYFLRGA